MPCELAQVTVASHMASPPELLTADEVATRLRVTPQSVYRWAKAGGPLADAAIRVGVDVVRFRADAIDALLANASTSDEQAS